MTGKISKTFKISWRDPESGELQSVVKAFTGDSEFPPHEWAQDYAYSKADKGWYRVEEVSHD